MQKDFVLLGDGVHDDAPAIQAMLDSGRARVELPEAQVCYLITRPLRIHSGQQLVLPRYCTVRLADGSDCHMLENADLQNGNGNFEVTGGIWDMNNLGQGKNPFHFPHEQHPDYDGLCMYFRHVKNIRLAHMTLKDPITFAVTLDAASYFTVEDLTFDFNYGNPWAVNMDGVHLDGDCHYGVIRNLKGSCYDDMVALNADEGVGGPISHIQIDGLYSVDCHSAVRLLSCAYPVEDVSISNVHGSFYQYCVGLTKFYEGEAKGYFDGIVLDRIYAAKAPRYSVYQKDGMYVFPFIWVESGLMVKNLQVSNVYRKESSVAVETIGVGEEAHVQRLSVNNVTQENRLSPDETFPLLRNCGQIDTLYLGLADSGTDPLLCNEGAITRMLRPLQEETGQ
ncbi:MAG TPA: hypothetical protein IAA58_08170 [Candidatus Gallacutalibacter stercoravium]|nr:hypothetical protein [Candidatus Gallacutalibacter stercoravium]